MILLLLPMIPILSALMLSCNNSSNFGLWPFRIPLYILAVLWYNWSSIGGALTRLTRADRAIFGSPHNLRIALRHVEQKLLMWQASNAQAWGPYMWQHCDKKTRESISFWTDLKLANTQFVLPIKSHRFFQVSTTSLRSHVTMLPRCFTLLTQDKALSFIYNVGKFSRWRRFILPLLKLKYNGIKNVCITIIILLVTFCLASQCDWLLYQIQRDGHSATGYGSIYILSRLIFSSRRLIISPRRNNKFL